MTMKWWKTGCMGLIALMGLANVAAAGDAVFPGASVSTFQLYGPITTGWQFTPAQNVVVTKLALWLPANFNAGNGFIESHPIAIWLASNPATPVVSGTVSAGAKPGDTTKDGYAYIDPDQGPVTLVADSAYIIAAYWATGSDPWIWSVATDWSIDPLISFSNSWDLVGGGFAMPTRNVGAYKYWSANFQIETNSAPIAEAGANVTVRSDMQSVTVVTGTGTDSDGDSLEYQWLEGTDVLKAWTAVGEGGAAILDLSTLITLTLGSHTLTLEVKDATHTSSDTMLLTLLNTPPFVSVSSPQVVELNVDAILITGTVADFDADPLSYSWVKNGDVLASGTVDPPGDGGPLALPDLIIPAGDPRFPLGIHEVTLEVSDGANPLVVKTATVTVQDSQAPTLAPTPSVAMLWPPNHTLCPVTIYANAYDNGGGAITLGATVACNEEPGAEPDWYIDSIDNAGTISLRLRAERAGAGDGRIYTVTVTATDASGNQSSSAVTICVPHDRRKK